MAIFKVLGVRLFTRLDAYRRLWAARTVSQRGDALNIMALALLVFDRLGSGLGRHPAIAMVNCRQFHYAAASC
jgi:hypothetical protein